MPSRSASSSFPIQLRLLSPPPHPDRRMPPPSPSPQSNSSSPSTPTFKLNSRSGSPFSSPTSSVYASIPPSPSDEAYTPAALSTPATLHNAIKFSKHTLIFVYSRQSSSKSSHAYTSFLGLAQQQHLAQAKFNAAAKIRSTASPDVPRFSLSPSLEGRKQETAFYVVCVEDVRSQDVPLVFGRLGVLPSRVLAAGSAVSLQRDGRLWRCAVGKGIGLGGMEGLLREVRGGVVQASLF